jgi:cytoskeleton protein RodZ
MSDLGELLRQARVYKGASLRDAERATRISRSYLEALENQDFSQLPPPAYARGIVKNYAQYLGLDAVAILSLYDSTDVESVGETIQVVPATKPINVRPHWVPNFAIIGFMLVVSAIVFAWLYSAYFQANNEEPDLTSSLPTVTPMAESLIGQIILTPTATPTPEPTPGDDPTATQETVSINPTTAPAVSPTSPPVVVEEEFEEEEEEVVVDSSPEPGYQTIVDSVINSGGSYEFLLIATEEVWLEVWLDWSETASWEGTLAAGQSLLLVADVATVSSGNAGFVQVLVDGIDYGVLSESWDATVTLP